MDTEVNEGEAFDAPDAGLTEDDFGYEDPAAEGDFSEAQTETPRTFIVKVPGGQEVEVDESELVKGYQRQADYTRKTQDASRSFAVPAEHQSSNTGPALVAPFAMVGQGGFAWEKPAGGVCSPAAGTRIEQSGY